MNMLLKVGCVSAAILVALLITRSPIEGEQFQASMETVANKKNEAENDATLRSFRLELSALKETLGRLQNVENKLETLSDRLHQLEEQPPGKNFTEEVLSENGLSANGYEITSLANDDAFYRDGLTEEQLPDVISNLETHFSQEVQDSDWGYDTEEQVSQIFSDGNLEGSTLLLARCHATVCKTEVNHDSDEAKVRFSDQFLISLPFETEAYYSEGEPGALHTVIYFAREGHQLPMNDF